MKKLVKFASVLFVFVGFFAFGQTGKKVNESLTKEQLINVISKDKDFIELGDDLFNMFANMPNRKNFLSNYDETRVQKGNKEDFLKLTGYTDKQVTGAFSEIDKFK